MKKSLKLALLFLTTLTFIACGGGSGGGGGTGGGGTGGGSGETPTPKTTKLSIANAQAGEGENITFTVTSNPNIAVPVSFDYRIDFEGQTASTSDLTGDLAGIRTIAINDSSTTISIEIFDDSLRESNETFMVVLSNPTPSDSTFTNNKATGTILASDPIKIRIADATGEEGRTIDFKITSTPIITEPISFDYRIDFTNQTAFASDLTSDLAGKITIAASSDNTISIRIFDDNLRESNETFMVVLSNLSTTDATFTKNKATGAIAESDPNGLNVIAIANARGEEGSKLNFKVTTAATVSEPISFQFEATLDNKLMNPASRADLSGAFIGTRYIATNDSSTTISIGTFNDILRENNEIFLVMLSNLSTTDATFGDNVATGTILDNDNNANGIVTISVADAQASEDTGTINFRVSSEFTAISPLSFGYEATLDSPNNSAIANDFTAEKGAATIPAGQNSTTISIPISADNTVEPDETFRLLLTNLGANATLDSANTSAIGKILNDDLGEISNQTAIIGDRQVILSWNNPNSNIFAGVTIAQAEGAAAPIGCSGGIIVDSPTTGATIDSLNNGTAYSFRICARNSDSSKISNGVTITNLTPTVVDQDRDGLIDIADATEFNNIRYNTQGTSYVTSRNAYQVAGGCPNNVCIGYELTENIDLSNFTNWLPILGIGKHIISSRFTAILEGNNKTISNLKINNSNTIAHTGLLSATDGATVRNLKLTKVTIRVTAGGTKVSIGALVGIAFNNNTFSNIELIGNNSQSSSDAEIKGAGINVGGLVGSFDGAITDASSNLTIITISNGNSVPRGVGGLVGILENGSIKNSNSSGFISAFNDGNNYGGLVGVMDGASISNSWASGNVSGNGASATAYGGLVGYINNDTNRGSSISQSWASGNISGGSQIGGLVGRMTHRSSSISQSWASGNVFGYGVELDNSLGNAFVGGLVGFQQSGNIRQSWASGEVTVASSVPTNIINDGGLVGRFNSSVNTQIQGRNYQLDAAAGEGVNLANDNGMGHSFVLGGTVQGGTVVGDSTAGLRALANLSGANIVSNTASDWRTNSGWHAGFGNDPFTMFCNTNGDSTIDTNEKVATNSVWVMPSDSTSTEFPTGISDNVTTDTNEAGVSANYYQIPALRCIANTEGTTDTAEINRLRKREIDRQRHKFPQP